MTYKYSVKVPQGETPGVRRSCDYIFSLCHSCLYRKTYCFRAVHWRCCLSESLYAQLFLHSYSDLKYFWYACLLSYRKRIFYLCVDQDSFDVVMHTFCEKLGLLLWEGATFVFAKRKQLLILNWFLLIIKEMK